MSEAYHTQIDIDADPERVFDYFVRPELLVRWMGDFAQLEAREGGLFAVDINGVIVRGEFVRIERPYLIEITWGEAGNDAMPPGSTQLVIRLTALSSGTRVELTHSGLSSGEAEKHAVGWPHFLTRLSLAAAGRDPGADPWATQAPTGKGRGPSSAPPEAWERVVRVARLAGLPLERFLRVEAASGILLLVAAAVALAWANSPWAEGYLQFWHTPLGLRVGAFTFERTLEWLVNDGLMVIFFFVVGLEIRREIQCGELSEWRRAALPAAAALGGMLAPAGLYLLFAGAPETRSGWGVPMATDIAFAVGILTLLGKRVPAALRVLLLALAVIDDLGAIVVIAIFYSSGVALSGLLFAALGFGGVFALQRLGVRAKLAYVAPAVVAWAGIYAAGIHPTIAGVIVGLVTPVRAWFGPDGFLLGVRRELEHLTRATPGALSSHELATSLRHVDVARREAMSPADSLIETLHPWVAFGIMPIFALANAGVSLSSGPLDAASWSVVTAVAVGLVVGKPIGVLFATWVTLRLGLGTLPAGMGLRHLVVLGVVAGVGFTMALFIAQLAFTDARLLAAAKLGVLAASGGAAVLGLVLGRLLLVSGRGSGVLLTVDEADASTER